MRDTAGFGGQGEPYRLLAGSSPGFWLLMYDGGQEQPSASNTQAMSIA